MPKSLKYLKGNKITSIEELLALLELGRWVYWGSRPKHPSVIENISIATVKAALRAEMLYEAIQEQVTNALP